MGEAMHRCIVAGAALTVGGLIVAIPVRPSLPDVQIRDADLAAAAVDAASDAVSNAQINVDLTPFSEINPSVSLDQSTSLGALIPPDPADMDLGGMLDSSSVGGLSTADVIGDAAFGLTTPPDVPGVDSTAAVPGFEGIDGGSMFSPASQGVNSAATAISISLSDFLNGLPTAYQSFTDGVVAAEMAFNSSLVASQVSAVAKLFTDYGMSPALLNTVFGANNSVLAQIENGLNDLIGAGVDPSTIHGSLVSPFAADSVTPADLVAFMGINPDDFNQFVTAVTTGNFLLLLQSLDVPTWITTLF